MDQIVNRPRTESGPSAELALGLGRHGRKGKRFRRWLLAFMALALLGAAAYGSTLLGQSSARPAYRTVAAEPGDITVEVSATGTLQPLIQVDISSELSGVMRSVSVEENQRVAKGDVLAELDTVRLAA